MATVARASKHYIVGIGASAGGMEAIHDLFDNLSQHTGFSFVIIQHLSPDYKSLMLELLSKHTTMRVLEASEGMEVEPDCIYLIPRKTLMTIEGNKLHLMEKKNSSFPNQAIDVFFESLARDKGKDAIGIILSGTGTDGSRGIEAIKGSNGIVIVQDPQSAAFDGMPNSAIATGLVDMILPSEMIGSELLELLKELPLVRSFSKLTAAEETILKEMLEMLRMATQHDFMNYKRPTLFRRLAKRMAEVDIHSLKEYRDYLRNNEQEMETLCKEFLINVTRFFRDPDAFEILQNEALPAILANKHPRDVVKVWVAACSSGEEAYTVAMLLLERLEKTGQALNLKVFATDIDTEALEIASRGIYSASIANDMPEHYLRKYFVPDGNMYRVSQDLRKVVVFANHDILRDPPFSKLDMITCRNMFIYLNQELQGKALKRFHFALNVNSFLMLGPSENIGILKDVMQEVNRKWKIYRCITKSHTTEESILSPLENRVYATRRQAHVKQGANLMADAFRETLIENRKIAGILIDKEFSIKQATGNFKHFLNFPEDNFNFNLLKLVDTNLATMLSICVRKAVAQNERIEIKHIPVHNGVNELVNVTVKPFFQQPGQAYLCVILEEEQQEEMHAVGGENIPAVNHDRVLDLERELRETRENLQALIEESETTNEELQSSNEELISTNEELQSTNEELQSLNEELYTVSGEHQLKIKELLELNDDLNNYFLNSEIGQILVDKNMQIRRFTPAVKKIVNVIETDIGRSIMDITTNLTETDLVNMIRRVLETNKSIEQEVNVGNGMYYSMRITPYVRHTKEIDGAVVNFINITESKRLSSIIEGIFYSSTSGITALKAVRSQHNHVVDFICLAVNDSAKRMLGLKNKEVVGKSIKEVLPAGHEQYIGIFQRVMEHGDAQRFEFYYDSDDRWFEVIAVKMLDGLVATFTDITDKKKAADMIARSYADLQQTSQKLVESNAQLERSNFDLLQFASVASHDLKEPLRKIQAFGNILQSKIQDKLTDGEQSYLNKIVSSSGRMQTLIEDVLTLSKLSNSEVNKEKTDLNRVIKRICDDLDIAIMEKNASIIIGKLPVVNAVPGQMRQLFQNLIANALKFSNKEVPQIIIEEQPIAPEVALRLGIDPKDFVCVKVEDNGIGFENEYKEKIFGIFQRLHGRNYEGTGIGLSIAKKIVEIHGGVIDGHGELDKGAIFTVYLPVNGVIIKNLQEDQEPAKN
ncbi:MAG TPA: chemotaxis protein CheB [Ohtaekwangia sp.]|uniref:chemotaxis protein CheB n=1 Tax=Ohtaekwangia sp. TaxID=2066019 RepID=UPI002F934F5E